MIEYATFTDVGEKEVNEDTVKVFINKPLRTYGFILTDGLGGYGKGDVASKFVADCVGAMIGSAESFEGIFIDECFNQSQELLMEEKERTGLTSIKTTMVLLLITDNEAQWGHIGDSRLYLFRNGRLFRRTLDHSVPQMLVTYGQIKEKDIRHHPDRNKLLSAMGADWDSPMYEIDERNMTICKGDCFLLCSDGLWEWIDEKSILRILKKDLSAYDALHEIAAEAKEAGIGNEMDNFSAILIRVR